MAITVRNNVDELVLALAFALNAMQTRVVEDGYMCVHRDLTQSTSPVPVLDASSLVLTNVLVDAPSATNLATTVVLTNQLLGVCNTHMFDSQAHLKADLVNQPNEDGYVTVNALVTDGGLAQCIENLNAMKVLFTAHLTQSGVHVNNDTTSYGLPANATNLATSETLANALATAVNYHMALAGPNVNTPRINIVSS